ncbi:hypothetical protein CPter291_4127 [Collimonas pratensis]|uniref:Uncharacterized protein n=2 Tax=Collimonas pratensis TaxID=279113 RepID=A0ABM5ZAZ7_9BURK|nr:hypothetical protein CPter291_4127 [Collimonas pratensis]
MNNPNNITYMGIAPHWPSRRSVINLLHQTNPCSMESVIAYNARTDLKNTLGIPPHASYWRSGATLLNKAHGLALEGAPWEQEMINALGSLTFGARLYFFWHFQFRILFPNHPQPLRMMSWEMTTEIMAMDIILGQTDEGIYQGYLTHATLNRTYQLKMSYEEEHRRGHAFMLRLFADWRGDITHEWPSFAFGEPIYESILEKWREPDSEILKPWLLAACDRHTHESKDDTETVFYDFSAFPRTPIEILFLLRLRELIGLQNPVLEHPLMESPFDKLPIIQTPYMPDELVIGTLSRVREDWPDFDQVVALDALKGN